MSYRSSHVIKLKLSSQLIGQFGHVPALQVASVLKKEVIKPGLNSGLWTGLDSGLDWILDWSEKLHLFPLSL